MKRQQGYLNLDLGGLLLGIVLVVALIAAPLGWLTIEGILWLFENVSISLVQK